MTQPLRKTCFDALQFTSTQHKVKTITAFLACIVISASLCSHSTAQSRSRVVSQSNLDDHSKFALELKTTLVGHQRQVFKVAFSPGEGLVATADEAATMVWSTTGQLLYSVDGTAPLFGPDGRVLLTISNKSANVWDAVTGKLKVSLNGHQRKITAACFSPDGSKVATGSEDGTVKLWDVESGVASPTLIVWRVKKIPRYRIISRALHVPVDVYVKFSPDGRTVLTNTYWEDSPAKLWDAATGRLHAELGGHTTIVGYDTVAAGVTDTSFSPDGKFIVTESIDMVRLWETATGRLIEEFKVLFPIITFSPDSRWLGLIRIGKDVGLLNLETLKMQPVADLDTSFHNQHAFSPDSRTYVMGSGYKNYHATLIDVSTARVTKIPLTVKWGSDLISTYQKDVDILSFHPSSKFLMGTNHNSVRIWEVSTAQIVWETTEGRAPAAFSVDGKLLVTVGKDKKTVLLWEVLRRVGFALEDETS